MAEMKKFLDQKGIEHLWSKLSMEDYPNNETLMAVINAIDETKADKNEIKNLASETYVKNAISNIDFPEKIYINDEAPENPEENALWLDTDEEAAVNNDNITKEDVENALGYTPANVKDVFENSAVANFTNALVSAGIEYGKRINVDNGGIEDTTVTLATTGLIPIEPNSIIRVNEDFHIRKAGGAILLICDVNKNILKIYPTESIGVNTYYTELLEADENGNIISFKINKPNSAKYIRLCNSTKLIGRNPILTVNEEIAYTMGYGEKLNPKVKVDYSQITNNPQKNCWSILPHERLNIAYSNIGRKPSNTVEHFTDAATNFNYNVLKCDVRPTSDGELVCCHDAGFTFNEEGYITGYDASNSTVIHDVTAETVLGYSFKTGEHPCLVGDYLDVCRTYEKVAFITIRNEYMSVVIPKLLAELKAYNMTHSTIINSMSYDSLAQWRMQDKEVMLNYTLELGSEINQKEIDRAIGLGYCLLSGFSLSRELNDPSTPSCDFEYARANGVRLLQAIAYEESSVEACYALGYDGCTIGIPWNPIGGSSGSASIDVTAEVGQTIVVEEVDANGKPTKWKSADYQEKICGSERHEIVPLTEFTPTYDAPLSAPAAELDYNFELVAGEEYKVVFDGVEYTCEAFRGVMGAWDFTAIGNKQLAGAMDTGEPFGVFKVDGADVGGIITLNMNPHSVQVLSEAAQKIPTKFIPTLEEMRTTKTVILPETTVECEELDMDEDGTPDGIFAGMLPEDFSLNDNTEYVVVYNGTKYSCKSVVLEETEEGRAVALGNLSAVGAGAPTTDPFIIISYSSSEDYTENQLATLDGSTSATLSITEEKHTPIPMQYMNNAFPYYIKATGAGTNEDPVVIHDTAENILSIYKSGRILAIALDMSDNNAVSKEYYNLVSAGFAKEDETAAIMQFTCPKAWGGGTDAYTNNIDLFFEGGTIQVVARIEG